MASAHQFPGTVVIKTAPIYQKSMLCWDLAPETKLVHKKRSISIESRQWLYYHVKDATRSPWGIIYLQLENCQKYYHYGVQTNITGKVRISLSLPQLSLKLGITKAS